MLKEITWANYFTAYWLIAAIYYLLVVWFCYREEFLRLLSGKRKPSPQEPDGEPTTEEQMEAVETKVRELRGILEMAGPSPERAELAAQLRNALAGFSGLRRPAFRVAITNYIGLHARELSNLEFTPQELEAITAPPDG